MVENDTAALCPSLARAQASSLRLAGLFAAAVAFTALVLAPVASAHQKRIHRRTLQRRLPRRATNRRARSLSPEHSLLMRSETRSCKYAHTTISSATRRQLQRSVLCLIDQQRRDHGLPRLGASQRLNRSAQRWTNEMVDRRDFSHGADFSARISAAGFDWSNVGENIATGFRTPAGVVRGWMASTGHCQNILNPMYREVGTGVRDRPISGASNHAGTWTQDFGLLMHQSAASENWRPADACPYSGA